DPRVFLRFEGVDICEADVRCARLFCLVLSPVPGEYMGRHVTGGYASLTPGYYPITPDGVLEWIPDGIG
ncbi:MAG: hypothetical protein IKX90_05425, partial [Verrucomicrobia bacterium]|nr:hypothetical protein [Verrucomicrobiota bacterium]